MSPAMRVASSVALACCLCLAQSFDAASVKPAPAGTRLYFHLDESPRQLTVRSANLRYLVMQAYQCEDYQLTGLSGWMERDLYTVAATAAQPSNHEQMMAMLRNLLAERFQLKVHKEKRLQSVYALVVAEGGSKLGGDNRRGASGPVAFYAGETPAQLTAFLNRMAAPTLDRPVVDRTGVEGQYQIWLVPDASGPGSFDPFTALPKQLGLRLEAAQVEVEFVVVDSAQRPPQYWVALHQGPAHIRRLNSVE